MVPVKLTVVIPTMNEADSIGKVIVDVQKHLSETEYEILVVDTDSTDGTVEIAEERGARVVNEPRRGYGRAYKTGFERAKGDYVATLDADCTYPAGRIPDFVRILDSGEADFIIGDRLSNLSPEAMTLMHRIGNRILNVTMRLLFRVKVKDSQSGMWVFKRELLDSLNVVSDGMPFSEEIKIEAMTKGFRVKQIPIDYQPRTGEKKLQSWRDGWRNFKFLLSKKFGRAR
ncbi:MAG: glycosyltransferase family 2 protein [Candidatus Thermoplasmatota archaeon]|nr:glycosyltransferase family 2 protein [Candidatus Thermoplasmatota archaeon]